MKLAVTSPSFSKHPQLIDKIESLNVDVKLNSNGKRLIGLDLIDYLKEADIAIVGLEKMKSEVLEKCSKLKFIAKYGVGIDNIDFDYCKTNNIKVKWTSGVNRLSVAEMVLGFMLSMSRNLYYTSNLLKSNTWLKSGGTELSGKTVGIIGVGHIGKEVIRLLKPFGCHILVNDIISQDSYYNSNNLIEVSKEELIEQSDIITVHTPLTAELNGFFNEIFFNNMKNSAFFINTARGPLVNENDLKIALEENSIAGAAIDVYLSEPPNNKDFLKLENLICTPHIGGNSYEAVYKMGLSAIMHVMEFINE